MYSPKRRKCISLIPRPPHAQAGPDTRMNRYAHAIGMYKLLALLYGDKHRQSLMVYLGLLISMPNSQKVMGIERFSNCQNLSIRWGKDGGERGRGGWERGKGRGYNFREPVLKVLKR